jgi:alpha-tubulin suppressor-like RCC1 family protein
VNKSFKGIGFKRLSAVLACLFTLAMIVPAAVFPVKVAGTADLSIGTAEGLISFAASVTGSTAYSGQTVELTNDIDLTTPTYNSAPGTFVGTFEGNGHTITNPDKTLFTTLGSGGMVRNLGVLGTGSNAVQGAAIVTNNSGTVEKCWNKMNVSAGSQQSGGIVNLNSGIIRYCFNTGTIAGTWCGGIAGKNTGSSGSVLNCYNTGTISGGNWSGGIVGEGQNSAITVKYCYNTGAVSGGANPTRIGGIEGRTNTTPVVTDCYWTQPTSGIGSGGNSLGSNTLLKTEAQMLDSSFLLLLNASQSPAPWTNDWPNANSGHPILTWQAPADTAGPTFNPLIAPATPTSGTVTITANATDDVSGLDATSLKWAAGTQDITFFASGGTAFTDSFAVSANGAYSLFGKDRAGNGGVGSITISNIITASPLPYPSASPTTPTNGTVTITPNVSDDGNGVDTSSYKWEFGIKDAAYFATGGTPFSETFTVNVNGDYSVFAKDLAGFGGVGTINVSNIDTAAPAWPEGAVITASKITIGGFTVNYPAATDNVAVTKYSLSLSLNGSTVKSQDTTALTVAFSGLVDNTVYTCTLIAEDAAGNQSIALTEEIKTLYHDVTAPTWGEGATITAGNFSTTGFSITYPAAQDDVAVTGYAFSLKKGGTAVLEGTENSLSHIFSGLTEATSYSVSVAALDGDGHQSLSLTANFSTLQGIPTWGVGAKLAISNVAATSVTLNWPFSNTPQNVAGYVLYVNGVEEERFLPSDYYCDLGGLITSTRYDFELKPFNAQDQMGAAITGMAVTSGAVKLNFTPTFAVVETEGSDYYQNFLVKYPMDPVDIQMGWNFDHGMDAYLTHNLAGISIYDKASGTALTLDRGSSPYPTDGQGALLAGDFSYTKSGSSADSVRMRLITFRPGAATLAQFVLGRTYVLEMQPDLMANNADSTLSKITTFTFTLAPADSEPPAWPAEAALTANKVGPESMIIDWSDATDNFMLKEYHLTVNGGQPVVIDASVSFFKLTGLTADTPYAIEVVAADLKNNFSPSLDLSVRTLVADTDAPTWPAGSKLTVTNISTDNVDLSWSAADDNVEVTGYKVFNGSVLLAETTAWQWHLSGLAPDSAYLLHVEAKDKPGNTSTTGPAAVIRTLAGEADTQPPQWSSGSWTTSTSFDLVQTYVTLIWPWAVDNVAVREYQVYLAGNYIATVPDTSNSYSGTLPLDGQYHAYQVYAYDAAGNRSVTATNFNVLAGTLPDDLIAPHWPAGYEIVISDFTPDTAVMSWSAALDNKEVTSYLLKRGQLWVMWINRGEDYPGYYQFTDTDRKIWYDLDKLYPLGLTYNHARSVLDLVEGVPYSCSLTAFDALGNSSIGGPKITFYPGTNPTAGSGITFQMSSPANSRGTLSSLTGAVNQVNNPTDPDLTSLVFDFGCKLPSGYGSGLSLYNQTTHESVPLNTLKFVYTENGNTSRLVVNPGVLAAQNTFVIKFSKDFASTAGAAIGFDMGWQFTTAIADKEAPTWGNEAALEAAFPISPNAATLSWPSATDNVGVTQFKVLRDSTVLAVLPADTCQYLADNLTVESTYTFQVQARDYLGNWSPAIEKTVTTPAANLTLPDWGAGALAFEQIYSDNLILNWDPAAGPYAVKEYLVYRNTESDPLAILPSTVLTYKATGLTGSTEYLFTIFARDYSGNLSTALSNNVTTAPDDVAPIWPDGAFVNAKDLKSNGFTLYWTAATDNVKIGYYNIYQDGVLLGSTLNGTTTEYPVSGLEATTKYTFSVEAVDTNENRTVGRLSFEQSTTVSGPTEGSGIEFSMTAPANENVGKSGNVMINRVIESMLDSGVTFTFSFAKDLAPDGWLANIKLVKNGVEESPLDLSAGCFTYSWANGSGTLKIEVPQDAVDMSASYQLILKSTLAAKDGSTLGKEFIWQLNISEGLYGIRDIAVGDNWNTSYFNDSEGARFYLMVKTDGTVWGWGNNQYGNLGDGTNTSTSVPVQALNLTNIVKVAAGVDSAFALDADGNVWGWGSNEFGQLGRGVLPTGTSGRSASGNQIPQKVAGLPQIVKLVYGWQRVIALDINGDVWTWGFRVGAYQSPYGILSTGTPMKVGGLSHIIDVATGWNDSLAVNSDGLALYWYGANDTPVRVAGLTDVQSVACYGYNYQKNNLCLKKDGTVWYWGQGTIQTVLDFNNFVSNQLVVDLIQVQSTEPIKQIFANSLCVMTNDRTIRIINIDFANKTAVVGAVFDNLINVSRLAVHSVDSHISLTYPSIPGGLALQLDGSLLKFFSTTVTPIELGMDTVAPPVWPEGSAVTFTNKTEQGLTFSWNECGSNISAYELFQNGAFLAIVDGSTHSYNVTGLTKGTAYTYKVEARYAGSAYTTSGPSNNVTLTDWNPVMQGAGQIAAGTSHTLMLDADGKVWAWGSNACGQLGIGNNFDQTAPCQINGLTGIIAVAAGDNHSLALDNTGSVWVWGNNNKYQLGLGTVVNSNVPVKLTAISNVKSISAAGNWNLAVKTDGTLWSWGEACNANLNYAISGIDGKTPGQMKYGTPSPAVNYYYANVKGAAASRNFYAVLFADGTNSRSGYFLDNVGAYTYWTMLSNPGLMGVQAISAGDDFLLALLEDGTVAVMGDNSEGQYGNGTRVNPNPATPAQYKKVSGLNNVIAISAGSAHGLALKADGSVWGWGRNDRGQIGNGNLITQLTAVASAGIAGISAIDAGSFYSIVLKSNAPAAIEAYAFGANNNGQLGTGSTTSTTTARRISFPGYVDTTAPVFPVWFAITATGTTYHATTVLWSEAADDTGIAAYEIWQNNVKIGETGGDQLTYSIAGLSAGQTYEIGIKARDAAGNLSDLSNTVTVTTVALSKGDVNGDNTVNVLDIILAVNFAIGKNSPNADELNTADYNNDGAINVLDIILMVNKALGR